MLKQQQRTNAKPDIGVKVILLLEDEAPVMRLLRPMLKEYSLLESKGTEQALRLFMDHGRQIDLLVADVTLPSGIEVALLLRSEIPDLPIILISRYLVSSWSDRNSADLERLGRNRLAILQKPFEPQVLRDAVDELLGAPLPENARTA